jgi:hypothetical protein
MSSSSSCESKRPRYRGDGGGEDDPFTVQPDAPRFWREGGREGEEEVVGLKWWAGAARRRMTTSLGERRRRRNDDKQRISSKLLKGQKKTMRRVTMTTTTTDLPPRVNCSACRWGGVTVAPFDTPPSGR